MKYEPDHWRRDFRELFSGRFPLSTDSQLLWLYLKSKSLNRVTPPILYEDILQALGWGEKRFLSARRPLHMFLMIEIERANGDRNRGNVYTVSAPDRWGVRGARATCQH